MSRYGFCSECGDRYERQSNAQRYCPYCGNQKHLDQCRNYRDKKRVGKPKPEPVIGLGQVDWLALEWEVYFSVKRSVALMRAEDDLLAGGRRFRHQAVLFPEADYARDMSPVSRAG